MKHCTAGQAIPCRTGFAMLAVMPVTRYVLHSSFLLFVYHDDLQSLFDNTWSWYKQPGLLIVEVRLLCDT